MRAASPLYPILFLLPCLVAPFAASPSTLHRAPHQAPHQAPFLLRAVYGPGSVPGSLPDPSLPGGLPKYTGLGSSELVSLENNPTLDGLPVADLSGQVEEEQAAAFRKLVGRLRTAVVEGSTGEEIDMSGPVGTEVNRELSRNLPLLLSLRDAGRLAEEVAGEQRLEHDDDLAEALVGYAADFVSAFAESKSAFDKGNQEVLGNLLRIIKGESGKELDAYLAESMDALTPGFFQHLASEIARERASPQTTPAGAKLVNLLSLIQARCLEEVGTSLSPAAPVLSQLLQLEDGDLPGAIRDGLGERSDWEEFGGELLAGAGEAREAFAKIDGREGAGSGNPFGGGGRVDPEMGRKLEMVEKLVRETLESMGR